MNDATQDDDNLKDFDEDLEGDGGETEFETPNNNANARSNSNNANNNSTAAQARHRIELYWERKRLAAELGEDEMDDIDDEWLPPTNSASPKRR